MTKITKHNVIACEYAAQGANSKHTLVNIYSGNIMVAELPATFPIAFFIELAFSESAGDTKIKIDVQINGKSKFGVEGAFALQDDLPAILMIPQISLRIEKNAELKVLASVNEGRSVTLFKKSISLGPVMA